jgi:aminoglycoside N3'-acetyltransferase
MERRPVSRGAVEEQLLALGVQPGAVLVVHTSFSKVGPVEGGPRGLIAALQAVLGRDGTLVMPSMTDDDERPFRVEETPCQGMGVVADTFWRLPGVSRTDNPHAFAARGPDAVAITSPQPVEIPHGVDSPVGRVHRLDGHVLLLGVGHDADTTIHLAENISGVRYRRPAHATILMEGRPTRVDYGEVDHCCEQFSLMDAWLEEQALQRRGLVGHGEARLARSRDIVDAALAHLRQDETIFLHPAGICDQCNEARASLTRARAAL